MDKFYQYTYDLSMVNFRLVVYVYDIMVANSLSSAGQTEMETETALTSTETMCY